jgi:hypothetical protein
MRKTTRGRHTLYESTTSSPLWEIFALWHKRKNLENSITSHTIRAPPPLLPAKPLFPLHPPLHSGHRGMAVVCRSKPCRCVVSRTPPHRGSHLLPGRSSITCTSVRSRRTPPHGTSDSPHLLGGSRSSTTLSATDVRALLQLLHSSFETLAVCPPAASVCACKTRKKIRNRPAAITTPVPI